MSRRTTTALRWLKWYNENNWAPKQRRIRFSTWQERRRLRKHRRRIARASRRANRR